MRHLTFSHDTPPHSLHLPQPHPCLGFQILQWHNNIPESLRFHQMDTATNTSPTSRVQRRLQGILLLRTIQMRVLIYRPVLHSATNIMENRGYAQTVVDVAKDTIRVLTRLNETTDIYRGLCLWVLHRRLRCQLGLKVSILREQGQIRVANISPAAHHSSPRSPGGQGQQLLLLKTISGTAWADDSSDLSLRHLAREKILQQYDTNDHYDHRGDDRLRSNDSLENDDVARGVNQENRAPSPLIPSQVSEDLKYQAHRDSLNLQHPQPRRTQQVCFNYFLISALAVLFLAVAHAQEINEPVNTTEILVIGYWVADRRPKTRNTTRGSTPESYRPAAPSLSKILPPAHNPRRHSFNTENSFSQNFISNRVSEHETSLSDGL